MTRLQGPDAEMIGRLEAELAAGRSATAQWTEPPADRTVLDEVNRLCARYGALLEVRFYGWYRDAAGFDADLLRAIPEVRRLTLNCLQRVINLEAIADLPMLEDFHFGVFEQADGAFLSALPLERLTRLGLEENRKRNFDLAPLARCGSLEQLFIQGHTRGLGVVAHLPRVVALTRSGRPKGQRLDVINAMPALRDFRLLLGSRSSIAELAHQTVEKLMVDWVRGLESLGDLGRFPTLRELIVEDQLQIAEINLTGTGIERLRVTNCKNLTSLIGLDTLDRLEWFHASRTKLDLEVLRDRFWPKTTRSVGLFSGSRKWNDATCEAFAARGITQFPQKLPA